MSKPELWVIAERRLDHVEPTTQQLITKAKSLASDQFKVVTILLEATADHLENELTAYGPDEIRIVRDDRFPTATDAEHADALKQLVDAYQPNSILFGATITGRSIAPRLQAKLQTGLTADCLDLRFDDETLVATKPSYGDNIMCEIICPNHRPQMASVRPNTFVATPATGDATITTATVTFHPVDRLKVTTARPVVNTATTVGDASRVVALGRGAASAATIDTATKLAEKLGGRIGVSRPLTDQDRFTHDDQIGQSGNTIHPELILNFGISGAVQYLVGMQDSQTIVAVNSDSHAPIFDVADYGYVGDAQAFMSALLAQFN
ncbi:electron transfer flavoprotein subunit alpha [Levilactobacillus koreensis JCM 16448]|uniref:Electron transfer flavoprotein subunit alpha n=1 Tax=Levilactobacillus koreensis TaxID=637971 RepID=A0AAC9ER56_9LACO|nr:electron transfer flavoprotein subunit alpha/FixB family protein [Levilactobacillus koreensis]AKP65056.1 electron transfer flavoprotein subunit alpha [Levilactobacillus koreensis]KRK86711.1 electron transfer flavoprotein subunit alpha [Levilactobacillus koreensis JCM 16448]